MSEKFSYKTIGEEQTQIVLEAYERTRSCLRASMEEGVFVSAATISRVLNAAIREGEIDPQMQSVSGRPRHKREKAGKVLDLYPKERGYRRREQAAVAGCSESTLYKAIREYGE